MAEPESPIAAEDRTRVLALAARLGMTEWGGGPGTLIAVGDAETVYELVREDDRVAFVEVQRGARSVRARFDAPDDAVDHLVAVLAGRRELDGRAIRPSDESGPPGGTTRTSTLRLRPVETPPPDPAAATETPVALAAASEIGWERLPDAEDDVLTVGRDGTGRIIGFRYDVFEYRSFAGDHRAIRATASTAAAARRLLALEVAGIARMRRRQQPVQLRVPGPAVGFTVTKGPTEVVVEGDGIRATFPLGPVGQQQAYAFTHCVTAALEDILASHRDPGGAPLLG